ncbi:MAG: hypothetical protein ACXWT7_06715 [Methylophilaceae bacterium]
MKNENLKYSLLILVLVQFLFTLHYSPVVFNLMNSGAISLWSFLLCFIASIGLYIAAIRLLIKRKSNGKLFLISAIGLVISVPLLIWPYLPSFVVILGALLGIAGWALNQRFSKLS